MSKSNATAASTAHKPEERTSGEHPHAHKYPGVKTGIKVKGTQGEGSHDAAALAAGRRNSMGVSADGSHKGLPTSAEKVGQK